uniref:Uncharacterized protein n=1 Tax=Lactuca sativa TaxID=4236 RepID=A0A9R1VHC4_LACSA|nr:hypothetical protein LSAT_V11C500263030 [Lactuca sativa]
MGANSDDNLKLSKLDRFLEGFNEASSSAWNSFRSYGALDMYLKAKLKFVRKSIEVELLESYVESRVLIEYKVKTCRAHKSMIVELEKLAKQDIQQKAKIRWLLDGYENSHFSHGAVNKRKN